MKLRYASTFVLLATPTTAWAVTETGAPQVPEIIVTAERIPGAVVSDVPPVIELDEGAIEGLGAASITDVLAAIAPQTGPGRGRGGGGPVILLNGLRISGFAEIRDLPPEAIRRVQILPEQVALQYGFSADQRVVNFILKDNYRGFNVDAEYGGATRGALRESKLQGALTRIAKNGRLSLSGTYETGTWVRESDRGIVQRNMLFPFNDAGEYRTLLPGRDSLKLNGVFARKLTDNVSATINTNWQRDTSNALIGVPTATLTNSGQIITRGFLPTRVRNGTTDALKSGLTLSGNFARWTWTMTGTYDRTVSRTLTDGGADQAALQALVATSRYDPFTTATATPVPLLARDTARQQTVASSGIYTLAGQLFEVPAGSVRTTLRGGFASTRLNSQSLSNGLSQSSALARDDSNGRISIDIPLAERNRDVAGAPGRLSINANVAHRKLSDFGGLTSFGYGLNWQPLDGLTLLASAIGAEAEPSIAELGNPIVVTPATPTFDFARGETVLINRITGGNRALLKEKQRDVKLSVSYQPESIKGLTIGIDYSRNRSANSVAAFPILTPEIEAAFPDRVTRDATGRLTAIDARAINVAATRSNVLRVGFTFQKEFGTPGAGPMVPGMGRPGGPPPGAGPRPGSGFGGGMMGGGAFGRGTEGGRWTVSVYDNIRFVDQIVIRSGLPTLDLLGGSAVSSNGGSARHSIDLDSGWFYRRVGIRLTGSYLSGSTVTGSNTASTLRFGDLAVFNLNAFINFDGRKKLVEAAPFFKGSRLRIGMTNIFDRIRDVRDGTGAVPLGYQTGYIDARGRVIEIDFRKRF